MLALTLFIWQPWRNKTTQENIIAKEVINLPSVVTGEIFEIEGNSANVAFMVVDSGGGNISESGLMYSLKHDNTNADDTIAWVYCSDYNFGDTSKIAVLSDLDYNSEYVVRAYAENAAGIAYGETNSFTTSKYGSFTDSRDGQTYKTIKIGNQTWMAENLNYTGNNGYQRKITDKDEWKNNSKYDGWCYYDNNSSNGSKYGVLYQWEAAKKACPTGWHLPSKSEYETLLNNFGGEGSNSYYALISGGSSGFSALFGGWRYPVGNFHSIGKNGAFWSSSPSANGDAWSLFFYSLYKNANLYYDGRSLGFSVRCLQD